MKIYLDNCCFNRPFDDQNNLLVKFETEAKLYIQQLVVDGELELIWSFILDYENTKNPYPNKREQISLWAKIAGDSIILTDEILGNAEEIMKLEIRQKDALHLACAVFANAEYFITTDRKLLNKTIEGIIIINPIDFLRRLKNEN